MQNYGLAHVWAQGDFVTRGIALALLIMSVLSWSVIVVKGWNVMRLKRLTKNAEQRVLAFRRSRRRHEEARRRTSTPQDNPFLALALSGQEAADHHHQTQPHLHDRMDVSDWITRCLKDTMDESVGTHAERPRDSRFDRQHGAVRRPVRHGVGHLSRAARRSARPARPRSTRSRARSAKR